jgi:hypothetical protein
VGELGDLMELLHHAHESFRTARGQLREWHDRELSLRAHEVLSARHRRVVTYSSQFVFAGGSTEAREPPNRVETTIDFWFERPDRIREEYESSGPYEVETIERDGITYQLQRSQARGFGQPSFAIFERDETRIALGSEEMDAEGLLELAADLELV